MRGTNEDKALEYIKEIKDDLPTECENCARSFDRNSENDLRSWYVLPAMKLSCKSCKKENTSQALQRALKPRVFCYEVEGGIAFQEAIRALTGAMQELGARPPNPGEKTYETLEDIPMRERFTNIKEKK